MRKLLSIVICISILLIGINSFAAGNKVTHSEAATQKAVTNDDLMVADFYTVLSLSGNFQIIAVITQDPDNEIVNGSDFVAPEQAVEPFIDIENPSLLTIVIHQSNY